MTLVPEVLQYCLLTVARNRNKASFISRSTFLLRFSSRVGANNNSSVNFHCCFFVDFDVFQIYFIYSVILIRASSCSGHHNRKCSVDSSSVPHSQTALSEVPVWWLSSFSIVSCNNILLYDTPMSHSCGNITLVPTFSIRLYVYRPVFSSFHFRCHDFWAMSSEILLASFNDISLGADIRQVDNKLVWIWACLNEKRSCYSPDRPMIKFWISLFTGRKLIRKGLGALHPFFLVSLVHTSI